MMNITSFNSYCSLFYSILKCEFGFDGVFPLGFDCLAMENKIKESFDNSDCIFCLAQSIADELNAHGVDWSARIDGQPNLRLANSPVCH